MQLFNQTQWWSNYFTHLLHFPQCLVDLSTHLLQIRHVNTELICLFFSASRIESVEIFIWSVFERASYYKRFASSGEIYDASHEVTLWASNITAIVIAQCSMIITNNERSDLRSCKLFSIDTYITKYTYWIKKRNQVKIYDLWKGTSHPFFLTF